MAKVNFTFRTAVHDRAELATLLRQVADKIEEGTSGVCNPREGTEWERKEDALERRWRRNREAKNGWGLGSLSREVQHVRGKEFGLIILNGRAAIIPFQADLACCFAENLAMFPLDSRDEILTYLVSEDRQPLLRIERNATGWAEAEWWLGTVALLYEGTNERDPVVAQMVLFYSRLNAAMDWIEHRRRA